MQFSQLKLFPDIDEIAGDNDKIKSVAYPQRVPVKLGVIGYRINFISYLYGFDKLKRVGIDKRDLGTVGCVVRDDKLTGL